MRIHGENAKRDDERWKHRMLKQELRYCGEYIEDRLHITNEDIHFYAWLCRAALNKIEMLEEKVKILENGNY